MLGSLKTNDTGYIIGVMDQLKEKINQPSISLSLPDEVDQFQCHVGTSCNGEGRRSAVEVDQDSIHVLSVRTDRNSKQTDTKYHI